MQKFSFWLFFFLLAFFTFPLSTANAAEFRLESEAASFGVGDEFLVTVRVDTEGESINAFEGNIVFPQELFELKSIQEKDSVVNLWIAEPPSFSGLTPGGYIGEGILFSLVFEAKAKGTGRIDIEQARALLNDGKATPAETKIINYQLSIINQGSDSQVSKVKMEDVEPPEPFDLRVAQDPNVFGGQRFLAFAAQDKNSGVDYYEVSFLRNGEETSWERARSPFLLEQYDEIDEIRVRAVDRAGNEQTASLSLKIPSFKFPLWGNAVILIGVGMLFGFWLWRRKTKNKKWKL